MGGNHQGKPGVIPMRVPNLGAPQLQIGIDDTLEQPCPQCQGQYFDTAVKLRIFSRLNPKNPSGQDALIKMEVYLCRSCGHEYGQPVKEDKPYYPTAASPRSDRFEE